jgi:hypothetical protein
MPAIRVRAKRKALNPSFDRVIRLMARWSCSTMLSRYRVVGYAISRRIDTQLALAALNAARPGTHTTMRRPKAS